MKKMGKRRKKMRKLKVLFVALLVGLTFTNIQMPAQDTGDNLCPTQRFSLSVGVGMRNFSEELYKDVYGSSAISYNVDFGVKILESLEIFLHTDYFSTSGELTYTNEETTLKIIPIELGARYLLSVNKKCKPRLFIYFGGGGGYYMYKEENVIGTIDEKKIGFFVEGGFRFYFMKAFFFDAKVKNVFLKVDVSEGDKIELGGLSYMGGIGISF
jgi:hypothetical protein